ncbi:MAG TPA: polysaccharide biosynthesis/export family protein [Patescibacteria group bacterium]|nr:polysaccharide biosynthesis/export family protein [Patescibacteria group bacterium]
MQQIFQRALRGAKNVSGFVVLAALLALSTGCSGPDYSSVPAAQATVAPTAPPAEALGEYKIQVGDVLDFNFYLNPEFNETVTVRPDGMVSTKIIPSLKVYNHTVPEINAMLAAAYRDVLLDPKVTTIVRSFAPIRIYVSGEVTTPGEYVVVGQSLTLTQAIARAGGIKNSGEQRQVLIIRRGAGEKAQVYTADYYAATQGADPARDTRLAPFDVVFVPKTGIALTHKGYEQYIQQFVNPSLGASYVIGD